MPPVAVSSRAEITPPEPVRSEPARFETSAETPFSFYEFFCGSGMARAGLGAGWTCTFANDVSPMKIASYTRNWGRNGVKTADVARLTTKDLPGHAALAWASFPLSGLIRRGSRRGAARGALQYALAMPCAFARAYGPRDARPRRSRSRTSPAWSSLAARLSSISFARR